MAELGRAVSLTQLDGARHATEEQVRARDSRGKNAALSFALALRYNPPSPGRAKL